MKKNFNSIDKSYTLKFDLKYIVSPKEIYNGMSYGGWATIWCNWLFSDQRQLGSVYFLRGNVDKESGVVMLGKNRLTLNYDVAVFFPIICTFSSKLLNPKMTNVMQRRKDSTEPEKDPALIKLTINDTDIPNLHRFYAESPEFILEIDKSSPILQYINSPSIIGKSEAITAGYWVLIKPLPVGTYRIKFEGRHKDGFETSGDYSINIIKKES